MQFGVGTVVWAMFGKTSWWPAIVLDEKILHRTRKPGYKWLYWFSDRKISQVHESRIQVFHEKFLSKYKHKATKNMKYGIVKALELCAKRANADLTLYRDIEDWVHAEDGFITMASKNPSLFYATEESSVPQYVLDDVYTDVPIKYSESKKNGTSSIVNRENSSPENPGSDYDSQEVVDEGLGSESQIRVDNSQRKVDCDANSQRVVEALRNQRQAGRTGGQCFVCDEAFITGSNHPLFEGSVCSECKKSLRSSFYAVDDDGCNMFCSVCGDGGNMFVCGDIECGKAFCFNCVEKYAGKQGLEMVKKTAHWKCFVCSEYSSSSHGRLIPRSDWSVEVIKFFQASCIPLCEDLQYLTVGMRRKLRVLSMFDGIGTGKLVLDELGLETEIYFASEISKDAMTVSSFHHNVIHLGDVWNITKQTLLELCPIDLVIGGPPCNDLSIVNPDRKGFNGTGFLVMKFIDVVREVEKMCKGDNHVFWLMENTANMQPEYKQIICRLLDLEPALWDAKYFTGQQRARYFWGNVPGMYSTPEFCKQLEKEKTDLDSALISNCNRKALVSLTRTITTSKNSLTINNGKRNHVVSMNGEASEIWTQELERLFGFPTHYTDVGQLSHSARRKLLGKAWSVPVIKHLLSPLRSYFKVKDTVTMGS